LVGIFSQKFLGTIKSILLANTAAALLLRGLGSTTSGATILEATSLATTVIETIAGTAIGCSISLPNNRSKANFHFPRPKQTESAFVLQLLLLFCLF